MFDWSWFSRALSTSHWALFSFLFAIALACSAVGFLRVVYFVSIGYALSVAAISAVVVLLFGFNLTTFAFLHLLALFAYGFRLGYFLLLREALDSYRSRPDIQGRSSNVTIGRRVVIWVAVSLLYVMMVSPAVVHASCLAATEQGYVVLLEFAGVIIMTGGLIVEAVADRQKSAFKLRAPNDFCNVGLFSWVRCPNYLGEIVFWIGNLIAGMAFLNSVWQWSFGLIGFICSPYYDRCNKAPGGFSRKKVWQSNCLSGLCTNCAGTGSLCTHLFASQCPCVSGVVVSVDKGISSARRPAGQKVVSGSLFRWLRT